MTRPRVVIAEDETLIRLDLKRLLEAEGFTVAGDASDGLSAVELAVRHRPDVVLLDVKMPRLDGVEAARRILAEYHVPIVMLTAYGYGELIARAIDAGIFAYIVKPFREAELLEALRAAVGEVSGENLAYLRRPPTERPADGVNETRL